MRRRAWVGAASGVAVVAVTAALVVIVGLPGSAQCRVVVGPTTVELTTDEAERASAGDLPDLSPADARVVTAALSGDAPHALTCDHGPGLLGGDREALGRDGLTPRADAVRRAVDAAFGPQRVGGFAPGGVTTGHMPGSAHYEGRAVDIFYRPISPAGKQRGWATAQWAVANAERLDIRTVIFDDMIWTSRRAAEGWRDYEVDTTGRPARTARILEHRDHVHVDVA